MADDVHAQHHVDAVERHRRVRGVPLRAHGVAEEVRRLLAVEGGHQHATALRPIARERRRDGDQHRDRRGVVVGAPVGVATALPEMVVVRRQEHPAIVLVGRATGRRNRRDQVRASAPGNRLLAHAEPGRGERFCDDRTARLAARRSGRAARAAIGAQRFDQRAQGCCARFFDRRIGSGRTGVGMKPPAPVAARRLAEWHRLGAETARPRRRSFVCLFFGARRRRARRRRTRLGRVLLEQLLRLADQALGLGAIATGGHLAQVRLVKVDRLAVVRHLAVALPHVEQDHRIVLQPVGLAELGERLRKLLQIIVNASLAQVLARLLDIGIAAGRVRCRIILRPLRRRLTAERHSRRERHRQQQAPEQHRLATDHRSAVHAITSRRAETASTVTPPRRATPEH